jgi:hypothetical protein
MVSLIDQLKSGERQREKHKKRRLVDASKEAHLKPESIDVDFISRVCTEAGVDQDNFVSRVVRLDKRAAEQAEASRLPTLIEEQERDVAEQLARQERYERETQAFEQRAEQRLREISRARNRVGFMRESVRYASWEWDEAERRLTKERHECKELLSKFVAPKGWERDYVQWVAAQDDWVPFRGVDGAKSQEALTAVRARRQALQERQAAARDRIEAIDAQLAALAELALVPFPTAEQVAAAVGGQLVDGGEADGVDNIED